MTKQDMSDAIDSYLATLDDSNKDEYWGTPRRIAQGFLGQLLDHTYPSEKSLKIEELIEELKKEIATLEKELMIKNWGELK